MAALVYGVVNQKGGVGKTTVSVNIACHLASEKVGKRLAKVLLLDADPQNSALQWYNTRSERLESEPADHADVTVMSHTGKYLHKAIESLKAGYDYVVIDGAPRSDGLTQSVVLASDVVVVPVLPSPFDIWATEDTLKLIEDTRAIKPNLKVGLLINSIRPNTLIASDAQSALKTVTEDAEVTLLKNKLTHRVIFATSAAGGASVAEVEPTGVASQEVAAVVNELKKL